MIALVAIAALVAAIPAVASAAPRWELVPAHYPTNFTPGGTGRVEVIVENAGDAETSGLQTVEIALPTGITFAAPGFSQFECSGAEDVVCTTEAPSPAEPSPSFVSLNFTVNISSNISGPQEIVFSAFGGGASPATARDFLDVTDETASFGVPPGGFSAKAIESDGGFSTRAGGHPYAFKTVFKLATQANSKGQVIPAENLADLRVDPPAGLIGNPQALPQCEPVGISALGSCPIDTQVGTVRLALVTGGTFYLHDTIPLYNIVPGRDEPGAFGFNKTAPVALTTGLRTDSDNGVYVAIPGVSNAYGLLGAETTFWGVPADPSHNRDRFSEFTWGHPSNAPRIPFLTNPVDCSKSELTTNFTIDSYAHRGVFKTYSSTSPGVEGCDRLSVEPSISVTPNSANAGSPDGPAVAITVPQVENPNALGTPSLRDITVTLPEGMRISPASANGLGTCSQAQVHLGSTAEPECPAESKVASVSVNTPLLPEPLKGSVYVGAQRPSELLPLYIVLRGPGFVIKLPGRAELDPRTGQVTARFSELPQLPFRQMNLQFKTGAQAPLTNPDTCGTYTTNASITPWSGGTPISASSSFQVTTGPNGGPCPAGSFAPGLEAGVVNPVAGIASPFELRVTRADATKQLGSITATLPKGLLATLKGVPYCSDSALASISEAEGTAAAEIANPACPAASQIGTVTVGAGAGPVPFYLSTGKAYLAGPYKGAPLSMAIVTPVKAGPFDLGTVVVRNALKVDPTTAQVTAVSDPLPTILHGIPVDLRDVRVEVNRPGFTVNPTSCEPMDVTSTLAATSGAIASPSTRFQVTNCERLKFAPKLGLRLYGAPPRRGANPALQATVTAGQGEANIGRASVVLPATELLEQGHIKTVCTRVQFGAGQCPAGSIYGTARAITPLLDQPLEGPVYLRSNGGERKLPDLVADLNGQIHVVLVGYIDSVKRKGAPRIRTRFLSVPDAPISKFVLKMQGGKKSLLANNTNLCKAKPHAEASLTGQNGKADETQPLVSVGGCGKKGKPKKK